MCENIDEIYGIKLEKDSLLWGSILPDINPKYRLVRHYKDESINYISKEIMKIIFLYRNIDLENLESLRMKMLSKRIGVVSHYLSDYMCLPHANRWTFKDSMIKHIKYESNLNDLAINHDFKKNMIYTRDIDINDIEILNLKSTIRAYIESVIEEYSLKEGYENDLNFALSLNLKLSYFIIDTIKIYSKDFERHFVLEF